MKMCRMMFCSLKYSNYDSQFDMLSDTCQRVRENLILKFNDASEWYNLERINVMGLVSFVNVT